MARHEPNHLARLSVADGDHRTGFFRHVQILERQQRRVGREPDAFTVDDRDLETVIARVRRHEGNIEGGDMRPANPEAPS